MGKVVTLERYRWLAGLGNVDAASSDVLSVRELSEFRREVAAKNIEVGRAIAAVDGSRSWAITGTQQRFLDSMENQKVALRSWYAIGSEISGSGTIEGRDITRKQASLYLELGGRLVNNYAEAARNIAEFAPTAVLKNAVLKLVGQTSEIGNALFVAAKKVLEGAAAAAGGVGDTVGIIRYLPWLIVGGAVAFYVLPSILRYRREGEEGLEADLRAGRARVEAGAQAARRGAAIAFNPAFALKK